MRVLEWFLTLLEHINFLISDLSTHSPAHSSSDVGPIAFGSSVHSCTSCIQWWNASPIHCAMPLERFMFQLHVFCFLALQLQNSLALQLQNSVSSVSVFVCVFVSVAQLKFRRKFGEGLFWRHGHMLNKWENNYLCPKQIYFVSSGLTLAYKYV